MEMHVGIIYEHYGGVRPDNFLVERAGACVFAAIMKFSASKDALLEGLASVPNVVATQTTLPILSNVLIDASDGLLRLTTTDLDLRVCRSVEAPVEQGGAVTLPARHLLSIVRALPEGDVSFEANGHNV